MSPSVEREIRRSARGVVRRRATTGRRAAFCAAVLLCLTAGPAHAAEVRAASTTGAPLSRVQGTGLLFWIAGLALLIALLWFIPVFYDTRQANHWRAGRQSEILRELIDAASKDKRGLSVEDVRQLVSAMDRSPRGASGLTSSLLALLIVLLVGIAMLVSLLSSDSDSSDLRKTIVTSLLAVLATISGFYFGARTAQTSTEQATKPPEARGNAAERKPGPNTHGGGEVGDVHAHEAADQESSSSAGAHVVGGAPSVEMPNARSPESSPGSSPSPGPDVPDQPGPAEGP